MTQIGKVNDKYNSVRTDEASKVLRVVGYIFTLIVVIVIAFFINGQFFTKGENYFQGACYSYDEEWTWETDSYSGVTTFPASIEAGEDTPIKATSILPLNVDDGMRISILTDTPMKVYVDGTLRLEFSNDENPIPGGYVKSHYLTIPLRREDAGKTITIDRYIPNPNNGKFNNIHYGTVIGLFRHYEMESGAQFVMSCILLLFSIMATLFGFIMLTVHKRKMPIILLSFGTGLAALWFIFDSFLYQLYMNNYFVDGPMEYMLVMLFPYYFGRYLNYEQGRRYEKIFTVLSIIEAGLFVVVSILHFTGLAPYNNSMLYISLVMVFFLIAFAYTIIRDTVKGYVKEYSYVAIGFVGVLAFALVQIFILVAFTDNHNSIIFVFGILFLLLAGCMNMIKKLSAEDRAANYALQANELKSSFLANMSHEIRTPINAIIGFNEMISRESEEVQTIRYSNDVKTASENLLNIVNDILDFSKIESGKMEIVASEYSIKDLILEMRTVMNVRARKKRLQLNVSANEHMPVKLIGDEGRVRQVITNLLTNAIKYTEIGSVDLTFDYEEVTETADDSPVINLIISVKDTGIGIKESERDKLFTNFERLDLDRNRNIEGTGLGLAITNNIIRLMGGTIGVDSVYGEGSTFTAIIPQKIASDEEMGALPAQERGKANKSSSKISFTAPGTRMLVVDDVEVNCTVVKNLLKTSECEIVSVNSGKACIDLCSREDFDLILMDQMMPMMNGTDALNELKKMWAENPLRKACPVIVLTANAIEGMREQYLSEGFDDYLSKPTNAEDLERTVSKYLPQDKVQYCK